MRTAGRKACRPRDPDFRRLSSLVSRDPALAPLRFRPSNPLDDGSVHSWLFILEVQVGVPASRTNQAEVRAAPGARLKLA